MYKEERFGVLWCDFWLSLPPLSLPLQFERSFRPFKKLQVCYNCAFSVVANASAQGQSTASNVIKNIPLRNGISITESLEILNMKREDVNPTSLSEVEIAIWVNFSDISNILRLMIQRRVARFICSQRFIVHMRRFWMSWINMGIFVTRMQ